MSRIVANHYSTSAFITSVSLILALLLNIFSGIPVNAAIANPSSSSSNACSSTNQSSQGQTQTQTQSTSASTGNKSSTSGSETCWDEQFAAMNDILYYKPCTAEEASAAATNKGSGATSTGGPCGDQGYASGVRDSQANKQQIWNFLKGKGLSDTAAAGIMGNMEQESAFMPDAVNSLGCSGIVQWCFGRNDQMRQWASDNGKDWTCLGTQLDFMWHEVTETGESSVMSSLNAAKTPGEAGDAWAVGYERMKASEQAGRSERAEKIYEEFTGKTAPSSSAAQAVSNNNSDCNSGAGDTSTKQGDGITSGNFAEPIDKATTTQCYGGGQQGGLGSYSIGLQPGAGGEEVNAADGGEVTSVTDNSVIIKHSNGYYSRYTNLDSTLVKVGDKVSKGQEIGIAVNHLDFGISKDPTVPNTSASENPLKLVNLGSGINNAANCTSQT